MLKKICIILSLAFFFVACDTNSKVKETTTEYFVLHNAAGEKKLEGQGKWMSEQLFQGKVSLFSKNLTMVMVGKIPLTQEYVAKADGKDIIFDGTPYEKGSDFVFTQYRKGKVFYKGRLKDGKEEGRFEHFGEDGTLLEAADFHQGKLMKEIKR